MPSRSAGDGDRVDDLAGSIGQGRLLFTEKAEPGKTVWIAAQLGELAQLREMCFEEGQKVTSGVSIAMDGVGPKGRGKGLDLRLKDLTQGGMR